jgi:endothelin-converting enzyme
VVCGNWPARNPIPAGVTSVNSLSAAESHVFDLVRKVLEEPYPSDIKAGWITVSLTKEQTSIDQENFAKLQDAYQVCMNSTAQEEEGLSQLRVFAQTVVESFPAAARSTYYPNMTYDHSASMGRTLVLFESLGIETTQRLLQSQYTVDPSKVLLQLQNPKSLGNPTDSDYEPEYLRLASGLLSAIHPANLTQSKSYSLMKSVLAFQIAITPEESSAPSVNATSEPDELFLSLSEIQKLAPQLNYEYVVNQLAPEGTDTSKIGVSDEAYWKRLSRTVSKTPPEVLQAFFVWKSIAVLSSYVDSPQTYAYNKFQSKQAGVDPESPAPRWQRCAKFLDTGVEWTAEAESIGPSGLTWILTRFFADKNFTPEAKNFTYQIIKNLEAAFISRIQTRDWATAKVKQAAIDKVHAMAIKIGLPSNPLLTDPQSLKDYYSDITVTTSHLANALWFAKSRMAKNWAALNKPFDKQQFQSSTLETNAFHSPQENAMIILTGIQQAPLYDPGYPAYITYGGMGSIIGHEITHGFDNSGHNFDKTGNFSGWFDEKSTEGFQEAAECFINQYSNFTVTDPDGEENEIDGEVTLDENVADAGGVLASYSAWKSYEKENGKAPALPGLAKYTHDQLFFIKYGQNWCENLGAEGKNDLTDGHAPNKARIVLPLKNSPDFQKAFNCPQKKTTCELW